MGKQAKGALSGAAAGSSMGPIGMAGGAILGGALAGEVGNDNAPQVQQIDPAFLQSLQNQANGTEKTAADLKLKAAFDQSLAQQVAQARAARGVNPALLQRNVARAGAENAAKAAQAGAEMNLAAQEKARAQYLQALQMNAGIQNINNQTQMKQDATNNAQLGSLINSAGGIGATFATANASKEQAGAPNENVAAAEPASTSNYTLQDTAPSSAQNAQQLNSAYSLGANTNVPMYAMSDERSKTKIKAIAGMASKSTKQPNMVATSDERQKDLIKDESLPQNGNLTMQNQSATTPAAPAPPTQMAQPVAAPMSAPTPAQPTPAPVPASQTALGVANSSLSKGGSIGDLTMQDTSQLVKPSDGPTPQEILAMSMDAQRRQTRDMFGNVKQSDSENYAANLARWNANNAAQKLAYEKQVQDAGAANAATNTERSARLAKFYTGTSNVNANDLAQRYAPKTVMQATDWQSAQNAQAAQGIGDQSSGFNYANLGRQIGTAALGTAAAVQGAGPAALGYAGNKMIQQSDERSKTNVKGESAPASNQGSMNPKDFLDKLTAYSYEYKEGQKNKPTAGPGRHLSVMAQDLEQAGPVGKSMVKEDAQGVKQVDYSRGFGTILAAQVQLNERLAALEGKKGKV